MNRVSSEDLLKANRLSLNLREYVEGMSVDRYAERDEFGVFSQPSVLESDIHSAAGLLEAMSSEIRVLRDAVEEALKALKSVG